jgi:hypothetical protein
MIQSATECGGKKIQGNQYANTQARVGDTKEDACDMANPGRSSQWRVRQQSI